MSSIENLDRLLRKLDRLDDISKGEVMKKAVTQGARVIQAQAKLFAPVDTGELRNSIKVKSEINGDRITATIYSNKPQAHYTEFGTGPVGEANKPPLPSEVESKISYKQEGWQTPRGFTRGQKPQPWLYPATVMKKDEANDRIRKALINELKKLGR